MILGLMKNLSSKGTGHSPTITGISNVDMGLRNQDNKGGAANPIHVGIFWAVVEFILFFFDGLELFLAIFTQKEIINFKKCFA